MATQSEKASDTIKSNREEFWHNTQIEIFVGFLVALILGIVYALGRGIAGLAEFLSDINSWIILIAGVFIPAYITAKIIAWRDLPVACITEMFRRIVRQHPELSSFSRWRALANLNSLNEELNDLQGKAGVAWNRIERHNTATEIFESHTKIKLYWATSTDPPYESSEAEKRFFLRQENKLIDADVRRLLVIPISQLLDNLKTIDQQKYVKELLGLHTRPNFNLRYWPNDIQSLATVLREGLPDNIATDSLVDFGIVDKEIVFGQKITENDGMQLKGNGRIITEKPIVDCYCNAYQAIWNQLKHDCLPAQQLEAWVWAMENRGDACKQRTEIEDKDYFGFTINKITSIENIFAVDVAPDMNLWWKKEEYVAFRDASINNATDKKSGCHVRIHVFRGLENLKAAELFIDEVVIPQLNAGIELVFMSRDVLLDRDLAAMDFISNGTDWGFYLIPTDPFEKDKVSYCNNTILSSHITNFQSVFEDLYSCNDTRQKRIKNSIDDTGKMELRNFLCRIPSE